MQARPTPLTSTLFTDRNYPKTLIKGYVSTLLQIPEENVAETLYESLPSDKRTPEHRAMIDKAVHQTINASGAVILMINTHQGLQLLYGDSQRRKKVVGSNGATEPGESIAETAMREFQEESGHPANHGILCSIIKNSDNCHSLEMTNQIGQSAEEIANRIINKKALYINISSLYVNRDPIHLGALQQELADINQKLAAAAPFYLPAVVLLFGDRDKGIKPANLSDPEVEIQARELVKRFKEACSNNITDNFTAHFQDGGPIKPALEAIVDLSENKEMGIIPRDKLLTLLSLNFSNHDVLTTFKKEFFMPSFENIIAHKGNRSPEQFLSDLEKIASKISQINLGFIASEKTAVATSTKAIESPRNN